MSGSLLEPLDPQPGLQVLRGVSADRRNRAYQDRQTAREPESEFIRGALGEIGEGRVPVEAHPLRGEVASARAETLCRAFPRRKGITKARAIYCCSRPSKGCVGSKAWFVVGNGSADCSDTTIGKLHEFFDHTGSRARRDGSDSNSLQTPPELYRRADQRIG